MPGFERMRLALRMMRRELRAGELTVLLAALLVAVAAMSSVGFFTNRVDRALHLQASQLLAADVVINSDQDNLARWQGQLGGLRHTQTLTFPSMTLANGQSQLATFKAVSPGYPLRGEVTVSQHGQTRSGQLIPAPGTVWADARLLNKLKLREGDWLEVGASRLQVAGVLVREPDAAMDIYNFIPRLMLHAQDVAATGLIQTGSRARWRLLLAGAPAEVEAFRQQASAQLARGERIENVEEARPEIRTALERAKRVLGLTALLAVALSAVAVALACRRYVNRHRQAVAVMRCLGASQGDMLWLHLSQFFALALLAGLAGCALGWLTQELVLAQLASLLGQSLPPAGWQPWAQGLAVGATLLFGFAVPPLLALRRAPTLAVLRDAPPDDAAARGSYLLGGATLLALMGWQAGEWPLALAVALGFAGFAALAALLAWMLLALLRRLPGSGQVGWRYGLANLARRRALSITQMVALASGLMALLILTVVHGDLLAAWQRNVPADAPNRFVINIQPPQREPVRELLRSQGLPAPELAPMVRARLLSINDRQVRPEQYPDERAQRLAEREFNLSWAEQLPADNRISAGAAWDPSKPGFSVEEGISDTLGIRVGDVLRFDLAGNELHAPVTSLRKVQWDTFKVNFFVYASPAMLANQPASYITSFHLPPTQAAVVDLLVAKFPNLTVLDVGLILAEVRNMVGRLVEAMRGVFGFSLLAGLVVLWTATVSTQDERARDVALLRTLGASRRQVVGVVLGELLWLGGLAGLLAALGALALSAIVSARLLNLPVEANPWLLLWGPLAGAVAVTLAGWPTGRQIVRTPPLDTLRRLG